MRNPNLTDGEKQEIIELLGKHPSYENKIDWNKSNSLTYEDFLSVFRPLYINDIDPRGLVEGQDYDILYESEDEVLYSVYTHNASKILASNAVEPEMWTKIPSWCGREEFTDEAHAFGHFDSEHGDMKPGAKWCISMQTSNRYWNEYSPDFHFFFWFRSDENLRDDRKIAIEIDKETGDIISLFNGADNEIGIELPSYIREAIENGNKSYKEKEFNRIKSKLKLNPQTNRYDYDGGLGSNDLKFFVSDNYDGFIINFGKITGDFDCSGLDLTSLKGAPQEVGGDFRCYDNQLTSLKGAPIEVSGNFICSNNNLTFLEEVPQKVGGTFDCGGNKLTSLKGAPKEVGGHFYCDDNHLTSLEGAPTEVGIVFNCSWNHLISLKGSPKEVGMDFCCYNNHLTSLEGAPKVVGGYFDCRNNPNLHSLDGIGEVKGKIYKDF